MDVDRIRGQMDTASAPRVGGQCFDLMDVYAAYIKTLKYDI